jgi:hypothetical protein
MFDPSSLTLGQVSSAIRDFTVVGVLLTGSWKIRGVYEAMKTFFKRLTTHMDFVEQSLNVLLTNHMTHIEKDLRVMARRQVRAIEALEAQSGTTEDVPVNEA